MSSILELPLTCHSTVTWALIVTEISRAGPTATGLMKHYEIRRSVSFIRDQFSVISQIYLLLHLFQNHLSYRLLVYLMKWDFIELKILCVCTLYGQLNLRCQILQILCEEATSEVMSDSTKIDG